MKISIPGMPFMRTNPCEHRRGQSAKLSTDTNQTETENGNGFVSRPVPMLEEGRRRTRRIERKKKKRLQQL
jgi:hypothetical protein